ncbi:hypothetical protein D3C71_1413580 [compost metagenome]
MRFLSGQCAGETQRFFFHSLGIGQHGRAVIGQDEAIAGALKQRVPKRFLKRTQPAPHGRLGLAHELRRAAQRAAAGNRQKDPNIAPLQMHVIHFCLVDVQ